MTELKQTVYKTIEVAEDEEYGMVVGNIVMDGDKMLYAEIISGTICDRGELVNARAFLDEVGDAMETEPAHNVLNGCQKDSIIKQQNNTIDEYKEAIRTERIDRAAEKEMINRSFCKDLRKLNATIKGLEDELDSAAKSLLDSSASIFNRDSIIEGKVATISLLKRRVKDQENTLQDWQGAIKDLKTEVDRLRDIIRNEHGYNDDLLESIKLKVDKIAELKVELGVVDLELRDYKDFKLSYDLLTAKLSANVTELSELKEDSAVLKKVVEIVKKWDACKWEGYSTLYKIIDLLVDYTDTPEGTEDTTTHSDGDNVTTCNTSYTVEMDIRCE